MKIIKFIIASLFFFMSPILFGIFPFIFIFGDSYSMMVSYVIYSIIWLCIWGGFFDKGRKLGDWLLLD